jgi:hypothetical protein
MLRRTLRLGVWVGLLVTAGYLLWKSVQRRPGWRTGIEPPPVDPWPPVVAAVTPAPAPVLEPVPEPVPEPVVDQALVADEPGAPAAPEKRAPPRKAAASRTAVPRPPRPADTAAGVTWVAPASPDLCPESHPIKAKLSSRLFHLPGMAAYTRTRPDRCYADEAAAEAEGFTRAKR